MASSRPPTRDRITLSPPIGSPRLTDPSQTPPQHGHEASAKSNSAVAGLALAALGVAYGDIGTSPLYALKESFHGSHGIPLTPANVLGILSLVFWAITLVVAFKYLSIVMRADNRGEGGTLALMALVGQHETTKRGRRALLLLGLFGTALLYGDGVITPAISVLGAMEGLIVVTPAMKPAVVPVTVVILVLLFAIQKRGTASLGNIFGPIMLLWFTSIAAIGAWNIWQEPGVLRCISPVHAYEFFVRNRGAGFFVLGSVVLVLTGAEALYADMGHFGKRPIRMAWYTVAMPALLLNYMGQGAFLLRHPGDVANPFYESVPSWGLWPMVAIATAAAIVASQALISGAFSITNQAIQLGYAPRLTVRHTSSTEYGQIYIPEVNWLLAAATVSLVLGFGSSSNLAAAYGIAVTGTMTITTILLHRVARDRWRWSRWAVWPLTGLFLGVDLTFLSANLVKVTEGGWFPLVMGAVIFALLSTWKRGREALARSVAGTTLPLDLFLPDLERHPPHRIPGTAVFMTSDPNGTPGVLLHHLKHNKVLHERVLIVSIGTEEIPTVSPADRITVRSLGNGIHQIVGRYGFMETPNVPALLAALPPLAIPGPRLENAVMETSYYLGRETLLPDGPSRMPRWRKRLFIILARNAQPASAFFGLPPNRVVEMGGQVQF